MCGEPAAERKANAAFPFCSDRCRLVDLGNWLTDRYAVPAHEEDDPDDEDGQA